MSFFSRERDEESRRRLFDLDLVCGTHSLSDSSGVSESVRTVKLGNIVLFSDKKWAVY